MPYILKVGILRLSIDKEGKDSEFYRWQEGKITDNLIKFMKAWNAKFEYHGFNVDTDDETPFECVSNALFKMYGNRDAGSSKFIPGVSDMLNPF